MKAKKSKRANLENLRTIFIQIGLVIALSVILVAFEWKSSVESPKEYIIQTDYDDLTILPPVTRPKAEVPKKVKVPIFVITPDEFEVPEVDLSLLISEIGEGDAIEIIDFNEPEETDDEPFIVAEFMPRFQGEDGSSFRNYVAQNVRFPRDAMENAISGTVYVSFVIDKNGSVTDVKIERGVHSVIDKAVLKVIENSPQWEAGMNNGNYVNVKYTIPISFKLI